MSKKRNFKKAETALGELEQMLTDKISAYYHAIKACEVRQDPGIAIIVSHRHAFILYRNLVHEAQRALKL